jgi:rhomboid protease GluP
MLTPPSFIFPLSGIMPSMGPLSTEKRADLNREFWLHLKAATPRVVVTPALLAINIGAFLAMAALGAGVLVGRAEEYLRFGANFAPLTASGEWWRPVTCTFVHFGIVHLAFNMWALWDSGQLTERLFGNGWFAALYLFAGVAGSSASMLWNQQVISAGASGAVFGIFGALLAYITVQRGSIPPDIFNRLRVSTSVFVIYSLFYGFAQAGIDNAAHLGGLAGGFVMGLVAVRPLDVKARRSGNAQRALLAASLAASTLSAAALLVPDASRIYRQAIALQKEVAAYGAEDSRLLAAFQGVVEQTRSGKINDATALRELRARILPEWEEAIGRLARAELDVNAPTRPDYDLLMRYALARRDTIRAIADYLETGNPVHERMIVELRAKTEEALKLYRERQKK